MKFETTNLLVTAIGIPIGLIQIGLALLAFPDSVNTLNAILSGDGTGGTTNDVTAFFMLLLLFSGGAFFLVGCVALFAWCFKCFESKHPFPAAFLLVFGIMTASLFVIVEKDSPFSAFLLLIATIYFLGYVFVFLRTERPFDEVIKSMSFVVVLIFIFLIFSKPLVVSPTNTAAPPEHGQHER